MSRFGINNGNRTERSLIRPVIIRVINKIRRPPSESPNCLITSKVLLPVKQNYKKICDILGFFLIKTQ